MKTLDYSGCGTGIASQPEEKREGERGGEGEELARGDCIYRLEQLAYLRSGDKGNSANIGVCVCACVSLLPVIYSIAVKCQSNRDSIWPYLQVVATLATQVWPPQAGN